VDEQGPRQVRRWGQSYLYAEGDPVGLVDLNGENPVAIEVGLAVMGAGAAVVVCFGTGVCQRAIKDISDWDWSWPSAEEDECARPAGPIITQMAKDRNNKTEEAKRRAKDNKTTPCDELLAMFDDAIREGRMKDVREIETARKYLNCKNSNKQRGQPSRR